jgi:hypothetical protein
MMYNVPIITIASFPGTGSAAVSTMISSAEKIVNTHEMTI